MRATLLDINECMEKSPCDENAQCTNTPGSFTCDCNEGYSGNGMTCAGQYVNAEDANLCLCVTFMHAPYCYFKHGQMPLNLSEHLSQQASYNMDAPTLSLFIALERFLL